MRDSTSPAMLAALEAISDACFVLSAAFEGKRGGVVVRSVAACGVSPPMVVVAVRKGHWVETLVRDSRHFALSRLASPDRLTLRRFAETSRPRDGDPFDLTPHMRLMSSSPVLADADLALDCELVRRLDLETEYGLYIGHVIACRGSAIDAPDILRHARVGLAERHGHAPRAHTA